MITQNESERAIFDFLDIANNGLGSESPRTHLSPCVLFRYNTMLKIVVRGDLEPIPQ